MVEVLVKDHSIFLLWPEEQLIAVIPESQCQLKNALCGLNDQRLGHTQPPPSCTVDDCEFSRWIAHRIAP
jgi:hypothetical protein